MKKFFVGILSLTLIILGGCSTQSTQDENIDNTANETFTFTDDLDHEVTVSIGLNRVVSLYSSYTEVWDLVGGNLVGVTDDATDRYDLISTDFETVGTYKSPNVEKIISLKPDLVILNPNMSEQVEMYELLKEANIPAAYFEVEDFNAYLNMLSIATTLNDNDEAYQEYGVAVEEQIKQTLETSTKANGQKILLLRAYSTNVKARGTDNTTGLMLNEFNTINITELYPSLLEELSAEVIVQEDPDFIFVTTMGSSTEKALQQVNDMILNNPIYENLTAVKENKVFVLPQDLFHYKPNHRWAEAYAYLSEIFENN